MVVAVSIHLELILSEWVTVESLRVTVAPVFIQASFDLPDVFSVVAELWGSEVPLGVDDVFSVGVYPEKISS